MLLSAVSVLVVAQSSSEIPEGLMNNPLYKRHTELRSRNHYWHVKTKKYYIFWVCVCNLIHPVCKARVPYYIAICGLPACTTIFHFI